MAGGIDWFRWHHGSVTDPKFQLVARKSGASLPDVLAVWAYLLETASASTERGTFTEIDCESWDCLFGFPSTETRTADILEAMRGRGLIGDGVVIRWDKRQPKKEDDTAAERKRRQREREHELQMLAQSPAVSRDVTPRHADVTRGHDRGEERREEDKDSLRKDGLVASPAGSAKGARIPEDWEPGLEGYTFAKDQGMTVERTASEAAKFRDYWRSQPGAKGRKLDWPATWRNWCRSAVERKGQAPPDGEPQWRREQRERTAAFAGRAAAKPQQTGEVIDVTPRLVG